MWTRSSKARSLRSWPKRWLTDRARRLPRSCGGRQTGRVACSRRRARRPGLTTSKTRYCLVENSIDVRVGQRSRTHLQAVVDGGVQEINRMFRVDVSPQFFLTNCLVDD